MPTQFQTLLSAIAGHSPAFRSITELQPVGGPGDKVFPATFSGGTYAEETRRDTSTEPARDVQCVLLDSVASQANRAEDALLQAIRRGDLRLPLIEVDFEEVNNSKDPEKALRVPLENLTSLQVPHRLADAILRDSQLPDGTRFSKSTYADLWRRATPWNATAIYQLCPTALLFGMWGSPEKPGGLGAKFERAYVSEVVGIDVLRVPRKTGFRIDPAGASKQVSVIPSSDGSFRLAKDKEKGIRPSEINHGNILYDSENGGVRFAKAEQTTVVSLSTFRKLRFPLDGKTDPEVDNAGRAVLAALGLLAGVLASEQSGSLRSRCNLWPTKNREWQLLDKPGQPPETWQLESGAALAIFNEAVAHAESKGLAWHPDVFPLRLTPTPELAALIRKSQDVQATEDTE